MRKWLGKFFRIIKKPDGSALVLVLLVVTMLLILGVAALNVSNDKNRMTYIEEDGTQALYTAESALNVNMESGGVIYEAVYDYLTDSLYSFGSPVSGTAAGGEYRIVSVIRQSPTTFKAVVESEVPGTQVKRRITTVFEAAYTLDTGFFEVFEYAIFADGDLTMQGKANTDSAPETGEGDIRSNEDIIFEGNPVEVNGEAFYIGDLDMRVTDNVTGNEYELDSDDILLMPEIPEEWVDTEGYPDFYPLTIEGDVSYAAGDVGINLTQRHITGNLSIDSTAEVNISGVILVDGDVLFAGQSQITGDGIVLSRGTVMLEGQSDAVLDLGMIISLADTDPAIQASGQNDSTVVLYAPDGGITLTGKGEICGSVVGETVFATGQGTIVYNQNLADSSMFDLFGTGGLENLSLRIIDWKEN
ncbi:DUF7305 domain-containing protein [Phosphitispora sp. TUW77]|uniref:DUF7305 domain-containing protein n=1 Tax=Phosphitispora sp. TUW77 TaxID=3152361 RepID=UPI003AB38AC2